MERPYEHDNCGKCGAYMHEILSRQYGYCKACLPPFCVTCGKGHEGTQPRCYPCFVLFRDSGGLRRKETIHESKSGMRTCTIDFECDAPVKFCRKCGKSMASEWNRQRYANLAGGECFTCSPCSRPALYGRS